MYMELHTGHEPDDFELFLDRDTLIQLVHAVDRPGGDDKLRDTLHTLVAGVVENQGDPLLAAALYATRKVRLQVAISQMASRYRQAGQDSILAQLKGDGREVARQDQLARWRFAAIQRLVQALTNI